NSDPHLSRALQRFLLGKKFDNIDILQNSIEEYFNKKPRKFYADDIMHLPTKMGRNCGKKG
ncbi:hypothetical protein WH47_05907, partial [Habropoda laboriosa]